jgi:hypothetical protein
MKIKIYDFISDYAFPNRVEEVPPTDFNYDLLDLRKKITMKDGDIIEVIYYADYNDETKEYSVPLVKENFTYSFVNNYPVTRTLIIAWYYEDGTLCEETKTKTKFYTPIDSMLALKSKRQNIIANVKISLVGWLVMSGTSATVEEATAVAKNFLISTIDNVKVFEDGNTAPLIAQLNSDISHTWLDNLIPQLGKTVRQAILVLIDYSTT